MAYDENEGPSRALRLINVLVIGVICIFVLLQWSAFRMAENGGEAAVPESLLKYAGWMLLPGCALSFAKALQHLRRLFSRRSAWLFVLVYLGAAGSPFLLAFISERNRPVGNAGFVREDSEQFLAGKAWAKKMNIRRSGDCSGSVEYQRGCRVSVREYRDKEFAEGRKWALENRPEWVSACKALPTFYMAGGCLQYYQENLEKPKDERGRYIGMTTGECFRELEARREINWRIDAEDGNKPYTLSPQALRTDQLECDNYDRKRWDELLSAANERIKQALDKFKAGVAITESEQQTLLRDYEAVKAAPERQPYKQAYLDLADTYFKMSNIRPPGAAAGQ